MYILPVPHKYRGGLTPGFPILEFGAKREIHLAVGELKRISACVFTTPVQHYYQRKITICYNARKELNLILKQTGVKTCSEIEINARNIWDQIVTFLNPIRERMPAASYPQVRVYTEPHWRINIERVMILPEEGAKLNSMVEEYNRYLHAARSWHTVWKSIRKQVEKRALEVKLRDWGNWPWNLRAWQPDDDLMQTDTDMDDDIGEPEELGKKYRL